MVHFSDARGRGLVEVPGGVRVVGFSPSVEGGSLLLRVPLWGFRCLGFLRQLKALLLGGDEQYNQAKYTRPPSLAHMGSHAGVVRTSVSPPGSAQGQSHGCHITTFPSRPPTRTPGGHTHCDTKRIQSQALLLWALQGNNSVPALRKDRRDISYPRSHFVSLSYSTPPRSAWANGAVPSQRSVPWPAFLSR